MEVVGSYEDKALSGSNAENRPGLQDAIEHAIRIKGVLVVYALDRFARSTIDALLLSERLKKGHADFCSVRDNVDTTTPIGAFYFTITAAFAQLEREKISIRTSDAMRRHQASGPRKTSKGKLAYGWRIDPNDPARTIPDDYELNIIKLIMDLRTAGIEEETGDEVRGLSLREIARDLTVYGYIPRQITKVIDGKEITTAGKWHFGTIRSIIHRAEVDLL
jgi:DNA invertase Pin-like site-specific DNA recombinase